MELERPVTRWRRENVHSRASDDSSRPKSRRGTSSYMENAIERSVTPSRVVTSYYNGSSIGKFANEKAGANVHVQRERLVSQQGLNLARTNTSMRQGTRLVRDKRYFLGALQLKMGELTNELAAVRKEIDQSSKDQATFSVYDKKVKEMATELTEFQGILADHNMAIDKVNTGTDLNKIIAETKELVNSNDMEAAALESLFSDRIRRQEFNREIEDHILKEKFRAEQLIAEMNPTLKDKFSYLKNEELEQSQIVATRQGELDSLLKTKAQIGDHIYISAAKTEAVELELKLWELQRKKELLKVGIQASTSPEEERSSLINKLKSDNVQLATIKKSINDMEEQIKNSDLTNYQSHQVADEEQCMRQAKYMELKKREETIEEFLSTANNQKDDENNKLRLIEIESVQLLKSMVAKVAFVPTATDYKFLQLDKTTPSEILNTMKSIESEHRNSSQYLNKVEVMCNKVDDELKTLRDSIDEMGGQLGSFQSMNELEAQIENKRLSLTNARSNLEATKDQTKIILRQKTNEFNGAQRVLVESELQAQVNYIEKRLAALEQANFAIQDYLEEAKSGEDIEAYRSKALDYVSQLNMSIRNNVT